MGSLALPPAVSCRRVLMVSRNDAHTKPQEEITGRMTCVVGKRLGVSGFEERES
jgi:hypothetical protein